MNERWFSGKRLEYMSGELLSALMPALCRGRDKSPRVGVPQQNKYHSLDYPQRLSPLKPAPRNAFLTKMFPWCLKILHSLDRSEHLSHG